MPRLFYDRPLSLTGVRDLHLDLGPALLSNETLTGTTPTVTSSNTSLVTVSDIGVNTAQLTNSRPSGTVAQIGDAVQWKATQVKASTGRVFFRVAWAVAANGSADTHEIEQELEPFVTE